MMTYLIPAVVFVLGLGFLIFGAANTTEMTFLGITFHPRLGKGLGIIAMIFSAITFLAIFGNAQPPTRAERDRPTQPKDGPHDSENRVMDSRISRRA
jgi:hypothetical protein